MRDFDTLLWQLAHPNVELMKDDDGWFLLFITRCQFLRSDGRCGIYNRRPQICREHKNTDCEFDRQRSDGCELYFDSYQKLDDYCRRRFKNWDRRFEKWRQE